MGKARSGDKDLLRDKSADPIERALAINLLGVDRRFDAEGEICALLKDPEDVVRGEAIRVLLGLWRREEHLCLAEDWALRGQSTTLRMEAVSAFDQYLVDPTAPSRRRALRILASVVDTDPDDFVKRRAYESIWHCLRGWSCPMRSVYEFDPTRDVDWTLVESARRGGVSVCTASERPREQRDLRTPESDSPERPAEQSDPRVDDYHKT